MFSSHSMELAVVCVYIYKEIKHHGGYAIIGK